MGRVLGLYLRQLRRGAVHDPQLALAFLRVAQLIDPPAALLAPAVAYRTLRSSFAAAPEPVMPLLDRESFAG